MTAAQARAQAKREADRMVAICEESGASAKMVWRTLTDLQPPDRRGWRNVHALIAAVVYADLVRAPPARGMK